MTTRKVYTYENGVLVKEEEVTLPPEEERRVILLERLAQVSDSVLQTEPFGPVLHDILRLLRLRDD